MTGAGHSGAQSRQRFYLERGQTLVLLLLLAALEVWAHSSADPDFYLPDPFRPLAVFAIGWFILTGWLPWPRARWWSRSVFLMLLAVLLVLEGKARYRATDPGNRYVVPADDPLLRYAYAPGADPNDGSLKGPKTLINRFGIWDRDPVIPKPEGVYRIAVLTGSITNDGSVPYDARFHRRLEAQLGTLPDGRQVETINVAREGYSTLQQVRLLEEVGLQYDPDLVLVGYMLTSASFQNGGYRRFGNSFFLYRFMFMAQAKLQGSVCAIFAPLHESYTFDLYVRNAFERLKLLQKVHGFDAMVAVLPVLEAFDDPICEHLFDRVKGASEQAGLPAVKIVEAFRGTDFMDFAKPGQRWDMCHPNAAGHGRIGDALAAAVRDRLAQKSE